jgi:hypothetical protein
MYSQNGHRDCGFIFTARVYVAPGKGVASVLPIASACDVAEYVDEIPHRLGHLECMRLQSDADILLLPGSSDLAYSPSKIYPYYLSRNPILSLVFRDSVMERLLDELNCACMIRFRDAEPKDDAHAALHRFFDAAFENRLPEILPRRNDALFSRKFLAEALTGQQCALFERALEYDASRR